MKIKNDPAWTDLKSGTDNIEQLLEAVLFDHLGAQRRIDDLKVNYLEVNEHATHLCGFYTNTLKQSLLSNWAHLIKT